MARGSKLPSPSSYFDLRSSVGRTKSFVSSILSCCKEGISSFRFLFPLNSLAAPSRRIGSPQQVATTSNTASITNKPSISSEEPPVSKRTRTLTAWDRQLKKSISPSGRPELALEDYQGVEVDLPHQLQFGGTGSNAPSGAFGNRRIL